MARKTSYEGDRFGDWVVMSKAPAQGGKRYWNVTNTQTDATRVVAQTALKDLVDLNEGTTTDSEANAVPNSWEITANVLAGNHAANPFAAPAAAFEPRFLEPCPADDACEIIEGKHVINDNPFGEGVVLGGFMPEEDGVEYTDLPVTYGGLSMAMPAGVPAEESDLRIAIRESMMQVSDLQHTLDRILKAVINL